MIATTLQSVIEIETNFSERENHSSNRIPKETTSWSCPNGIIKNERNELKTAFTKQYMKYLWRHDWEYKSFHVDWPYALLNDNAT